MFSLLILSIAPPWSFFNWVALKEGHGTGMGLVTIQVSPCRLNSSAYKSGKKVLLGHHLRLVILYIHI